MTGTSNEAIPHLTLRMREPKLPTSLARGPSIHGGPSNSPHLTATPLAPVPTPWWATSPSLSWMCQLWSRLARLMPGQPVFLQLPPVTTTTRRRPLSGRLSLALPAVILMPPTLHPATHASPPVGFGTAPQPYQRLPQKSTSAAAMYWHALTAVACEAWRRFYAKQSHPHL